MNIKNLELSLNLNENEEVFYVAEKSKSAYIVAMISMPLIALIFGSSATLMLVQSDSNLIWILLQYFLAVCFILGIFNLKNYYYLGNVILTNQRILVITPKSQVVIPFEKISYVNPKSGYYSNILRINLKSGNLISLLFIKGDIFKNKFMEVYPQYKDPDMTGTKISMYFILILLLVAFFLMIKNH